MFPEPELDELLGEVRRLWHVLIREAERLHGAKPVTVGMRAVMELLARGGGTTVPRMARARSVSRQHIQMLVNELVARGLVTLEDNPEHRRSPLLALTPRGDQTLARMLRRERRLLARVDATAADVERATATLRRVRVALEGRP